MPSFDFPCNHHLKKFKLITSSDNNLFLTEIFLTLWCLEQRLRQSQDSTWLVWSSVSERRAVSASIGLLQLVSSRTQGHRGLLGPIQAVMAPMEDGTLGRLPVTSLGRIDGRTSIHSRAPCVLSWPHPACFLERVRKLGESQGEPQTTAAARRYANVPPWCLSYPHQQVSLQMNPVNIDQG